MAGVGFRLQNYFRSGVSTNKKLSGVLSGVIFSSGPWLMTIAGIAILTQIMGQQLMSGEVTRLKTIWTYSYAVSLLLFGILEMPLTKFISDKMYEHDLDSLNALYRGTVLLALVISAIVSLFLFIPLKLSFYAKLACFTFLFSTVVIWISMVYLSAAKNYKAIVSSFLIGTILGVVACSSLGAYFPVDGHLWGYALGQLVLMLSLYNIVLLEFPNDRPNWIEIFDYVSQKKHLAFIGLFYYLGIWADKFVFWLFGGGENIEWVYYTHSYYDTALFLSFISVVPAFTFFLIHVETNLFVHIKKFISGVEGQSRLNDIEDDKSKIGQSIRHGLYILGAIQLTVSIIGIFYLPVYLDNIKATTLIGPVFRYGLAAAFFQSLFMVVNILLYYFNAEKIVLRNYIIFFVLNLTFSAMSVGLGLKFHGIGIVLASFLAFIISLLAINKEYRGFEYNIFVQLNPIGGQRDRLI